VHRKTLRLSIWRSQSLTLSAFAQLKSVAPPQVTAFLAHLPNLENDFRLTVVGLDIVSLELPTSQLQPAIRGTVTVFTVLFLTSFLWKVCPDNCRRPVHLLVYVNASTLSQLCECSHNMKLAFNE